MYRVIPSSKFRKDSKLAEKRGYDTDLLTAVIKKLARGETLDEKYRDHALKGDCSGYRECHVTGDWLLVYRFEDGSVVLYLFGTGTRSYIFGS